MTRMIEVVTIQLELGRHVRLVTQTQSQAYFLCLGPQLNVIGHGSRSFDGHTVTVTVTVPVARHHDSYRSSHRLNLLAGGVGPPAAVGIKASGSGPGGQRKFA